MRAVRTFSLGANKASVKRLTLPMGKPFGHLLSDFHKLSGVVAGTVSQGSDTAAGKRTIEPPLGFLGDGKAEIEPCSRKDDQCDVPFGGSMCRIFFGVFKVLMRNSISKCTCETPSKTRRARNGACRRKPPWVIFRPVFHVVTTHSCISVFVLCACATLGPWRTGVR